MEGFPNDPMTLHQYVYGNNDPVNFIDPSGKRNLPQTLVTAGIIVNLAAMAVGHFTEWRQDIWTLYAEDIFPEAYIVGYNCIATLPVPFKTALKLISDQSPIPFSLEDDLNNTLFGFGVELVLSVGSGEAALFTTITFRGTLAFPNLSAGGELYDGFVFNLWNARDYRGPFESISLNLDKLGGVGVCFGMLHGGLPDYGEDQDHSFQ